MTTPAASAAGAVLSFFGVTKREREKRVLLAAYAGLSFLDIYVQRTMTKKGRQETSRTYCKHSRHLSVCGQYQKRSGSKSSTASWGWSGGAKVLGKLPVPGRPIDLE